MLVMENAQADTPRHASFAISASPESVGLARKMTEDVLRAWTSPVDEFTAMLLLSEVFTNALLHGVNQRSAAMARIGVELVETETGLHVEVHDPNQGKHDDVVANHATVQSESGRGLDLVEALAASWGCKHTPSGKLVFFDVLAPAFEQGREVVEGPRAPAACVVNRRSLRHAAPESRIPHLKGGSL
jgi:anti-sigma regulatory factor (Ser/Thr protein kinase)